MRFIVTLLIILMPEITFSQTHGCLSKCLARGGMPADCSTQCGITVHGSVNLPEKSKKIENGISKGIQKEVGNNIEVEGSEAAFSECYDIHCRQGNSGLPLEQCIENCAKLSIFDSSGGTNVPGSRGGDSHNTGTFESVDFDCFRTCREEGDSLESCRTLCKK